HPNAELHSTVQVGAYAVIGANVQVGPETVIGAHAVVEGPCKMDREITFFPGAVIGMEPQDLKSLLPKVEAI
ncbi:hypothetical protein FLX35_03470, partial [Cylindrospermopsis raciborskii LB2897]|nr:hypothetical protein [Cylindrospermopsis raciborskii LB2897]